MKTIPMLGLVLSAVGLYGVLAFVVNRSVSEIGIRMALGATPRMVLGLFIRRGLTISIAGSLLGTLAALAAGRSLAGYLYGVSPSDPVIFAAVPALLLAVAGFSCYLPARRAAGIEPLRALRHE